jgi:hypothetical protein
MLRVNAAVLLLCAVLLGSSAAAVAEEDVDVSGMPDASGEMARPRLERAPTDSTAADTLRVLPDRVDILYFHRTARCENCVRFEEYSAGVLADSLSLELERGTVTWRTVNLDDEVEGALVERYDVFESSLVLSVVEDGEEVEWSKLDGIWVFVEDEAMFRRYVLGEVVNALDNVGRTQ